MTAQVASSTQQVLEAIWNETLQRSAPIGPADSFFELGGDSVMMMMMLFRVTHVLGVEVPPEQVFANPTLGALSDQIDVLRQGGSVGAGVVLNDSGVI
jgi:acyl carrier protein